MSHKVLVGLDFFKHPLHLKIGKHFSAGLKAVKAGIGACLCGHASVFTDDFDDIELVFQPYFKVIGIMGRRNLQSAGAELKVDIAVPDNRDSAIHKRQHNGFPYPLFVARVFRVYGDCRIAQHGFGPRCGNRQAG